jgi:3-phytase
MTTLASCLLWASTFFAIASAQVANITLVPTATGVDGDNTDFVYGRSPLLVVNDGSAADGGFRTFAVSNSTPFKQIAHQNSGRSKIAVSVHDIGGRDLIINIPSPDSRIRVFDAATGKKVDSNDKTQLGDWSTACVWRSQKSGGNYMFLFGKRMVVQFLVRGDKKDVEILEVCCFSFRSEREFISARYKHSLFRSRVMLVLSFPPVKCSSLPKTSHCTPFRPLNPLSSQRSRL